MSSLVRRVPSRLRLERARRRAAGIDVRAALDATAPIDDAEAGVLSVTCIVFSKDRPMQLDACLRSIEAFARYDGPIVVVYKATTPEFARGYSLLARSERVRLVAETRDFRRDVVDAIAPGTTHTVFHTDDDVFFRRLPAVPAVPEGFAAFSLRLGENTTYCYQFDRTQAAPDPASRDPVLAWNWTRTPVGDYSCVMSLDGHVFRTSLLVRMLSGAKFSNPNHLEEALMERRYLAPPLILSFRQSCLVSIPVNLVTSTHRNRSGGDARLSSESLNARFLAGERIDLDAMDFSSVCGAHQEVRLEFSAGSTSALQHSTPCA